MADAQSLSFLVKNTAQHQLDAIRNRTVVVALSGGADSISLLRVLLDLQKEYNLTLYAAHLDHGLRPTSAEQAAELGRTCEKLGVHLFNQRGNTRQYAQRNKLSLEAAARTLRYKYLAEVALPLRATVAVAHNQNDQAETVLWNLTRGSGLAGIAGISPVTTVLGHPDIPLVRPLLAISAATIREFCQEQGLPVIEDETNRLNIYTRNRIRQSIIPQLQQLNGRAVEHIARFAELARQDELELAALAEARFRTISRVSDRNVALPIDVTTELSDSSMSRIIRRALVEVAGDLSGFTSTHIDALLGFWRSGHEGQQGEFPSGVRSLIAGGQLILWRGVLRLEELYGLPLLREAGRAELSPGWRWEVHLNECSRPDEASGTRCHEHVRFSATPFELRAAQPNEKFQPLGSRYSKTVARFLADQKSPRELRHRIPIVASDGGVVWVMGWRIDERWKLKPHDERFVCLVAYRE